MDLEALKGIELWKKNTAIFLSASSCFFFRASSTSGCALGEGRGNNKEGPVLPCCPLDPWLGCAPPLAEELSC
uniref:Uncharacterized protein n=1 Tax=Populus trichocarpa TaxID=3694 RepID=A0A2K2BW80_POPTR